MKINKVFCCLNLNEGCFLFGLFDLAVNIFHIVYFSILVHEISNTKNILSLLIAVIGVCTCLLMICGSMMKKRWLLLPHIIWLLILIGLYASQRWAEIYYCFQHEENLSALMIATVMYCVLFVFIYYEIVMYNRFLEIKEKQAAPPVYIEME